MQALLLSTPSNEYQCFSLPLTRQRWIAAHKNVPTRTGSSNPLSKASISARVESFHSCTGWTPDRKDCRNLFPVITKDSDLTSMNHHWSFEALAQWFSIVSMACHLILFATVLHARRKIGRAWVWQPTKIGLGDTNHDYLFHSTTFDWVWVPYTLTVTFSVWS